MVRRGSTRRTYDAIIKARPDGAFTGTTTSRKAFSACCLNSLGMWLTAAAWASASTTSWTTVLCMCACDNPWPSHALHTYVEDSKWHAVLSVARIARLAAICVGCRQVRRGHIARNAPLLARVGHAVGNLVASRERVFRICLSGPQRGALVAASLPRALPLDAVRHCPKIDRKFTS